LGLKGIDMLLLAFEDGGKEVAGYKVVHAFAMSDRLAKLRYRLLLETQIAFENFRHGLANPQPAGDIASRVPIRYIGSPGMRASAKAV
jgi:hypothetical protein